MSESDYPYVRAWGRRLGIGEMCIRRQVERARRDGAPQSAVYSRGTDGWVTTDEITRPEARADLGLPVTRGDIERYAVGVLARVALDLGTAASWCEAQGAGDVAAMLRKLRGDALRAAGQRDAMTGPAPGP